MMLKRILMAVSLVLVNPVFASDKQLPLEPRPVLIINGERYEDGALIAYGPYTGMCISPTHADAQRQRERREKIKEKEAARREDKFITEYVAMCNRQLYSGDGSKVQLKLCLDMIHPRYLEKVSQMLGEHKI